MTSFFFGVWSHKRVSFYNYYSTHLLHILAHVRLILSAFMNDSILTIEGFPRFYVRARFVYARDQQLDQLVVGLFRRREQISRRYAVLVGSLIEPPLAEFTRGERAV